MKTALIFGSSGLVGKNLLNQIINNSNYSKVKIFVRSSLEISDPKVEIINTDFKDLQKIENLIIGDDCFFCIGTTKKNSPDKNEYRRIELDLPKKLLKLVNLMILDLSYMFHQDLLIQKILEII